jgi:AcrR family transcriptional regulator
MKAGVERGRRDDWLDAAYHQLVQSGVESVKILPLAKALKTSRTSFYWCFKDREALLDALIERWKAKNTRGLVSQSQCYADTVVEAMLNVFDCWLDEKIFDSEFEFAVRNWAMQSPKIAQEVATADQVRLEALTKMLARVNYTPHNANVRARTVYLNQSGYISTRAHEAKEQRMARVGEYVEIFTGQPGQRQEIERFASRHTDRLAEWMQAYDEREKTELNAIEC